MSSTSPRTWCPRGGSWSSFWQGTLPHRPSAPGGGRLTAPPLFSPERPGHAAWTANCGLRCPGARCTCGHLYAWTWCSLWTIHDKHSLTRIAAPARRLSLLATLEWKWVQPLSRMLVPEPLPSVEVRPTISWTSQPRTPAPTPSISERWRFTSLELASAAKHRTTKVLSSGCQAKLFVPPAVSEPMGRGSHVASLAWVWPYPWKKFSLFFFFLCTLTSNSLSNLGPHAFQGRWKDFFKPYDIH